jgi:hypothetical protein
MKILFNSLLIIFLFSITSCKKEEGVAVDVGIEINVVNNEGKDLLNSVYTMNNIHLSHIVNGQAQPYNQGGGIYTGTHVLTLFPYDYNQPNVTLIQFGASKPDTIRREFLKGHGYVYCSKVWLNDTLKFDDSKQTNMTPRRFTIVK